MPQISVDYSDRLADAFDRPGFGRELNRLAVKLIDARPEACKVRFRRTEDAVIGDSAGSHGHLLVEFQIFPGRTPEAKAALSEAVLEALPEFLAPVAGLPVDAAVNIVDIDRGSYRGVTLNG